MVSATSTIGKCHIVRENEKFYYKVAVCAQQQHPR
jgi:hypothetical protein